VSGKDELRQSADSYLGDCFARETPPHVNEFAAILRMSVPKLSNRFLREVGERPSKYFKRKQVERAVHLIKNTSLDYPTIAKAAGFGSVTALFRSVRRITRRTAESFRRKRRKKR
jgi:transcriptional regulator GlxA family with amidase domain